MNTFNIEKDLFYPVNKNIKINREFISEAFKIVTGFNILKPVTIHCAGSSGAILAAFLIATDVFKYDVIINHVRKNGENGHRPEALMYDRNRYNILIDDFVSSGFTYKRIINKSSIRHLDLVILARGFIKVKDVVPVDNLITC